MVKMEYSIRGPMTILVVALTISSFSMVALADGQMGCQGLGSQPKDGLGSHITNSILANTTFDPSTLLHLSDDDYFQMVDLAGAAMFAVLAGAPIVEHYDPSAQSFDSSSVKLGAAGHALMNLRFYESSFRFSFSRAKQAIINAHNYIDTALALLPHNMSNVGFLGGSSGVYAIASVVYQIVGDYANSDNMLVNLRHLIKYSVNQSDYSQFPMHLENGIAGLAYSARFVNSYFPEPVIDSSMYTSMIEILVQFGTDHKVSEAGDIWSWPSSPKDSNTGLFQGDSGPLYTILQAARFDLYPAFKTDAKINGTAQDTVDALLSNHQYLTQKVDFTTFGDDDAPTNLYDGAASYIPVFWTAYRVFDDIKYYNASMNAASYTAKNGILNTGMQMGVGTAGNAYMILWLASEMLQAQTFDDQKPDKPDYDNDIKRLVAWANSMHKISLETSTLTDPSKMVSYSCSPFSFWRDSPSGIAMAYFDLVNHHFNIQDIHMPGFSELI